MRPIAFGRSPLGIAAASLCAWIVLATARGRYWEARTDELRGMREDSEDLPRVEAVVPARDEAETIGIAIGSLVAQTYRGAFSVTLVDDDSSDGTSAVAVAAAAALQDGDRFHAVPGRPLRKGWTGKLNALDAGIERVKRERGEPDFWLFTDADIRHHPHNVAELVAKARRDDLDIVSLMVRLRSESAWEKLLVPAFVYFFAKLYPFAWSNDPRRSTAAAAGGCVLLRASALVRIGGIASIGGALIDDCSLARAVKRDGGKIWLGLSSQTTSIRGYGTLESVWHMVKRSAFTQLDRSYLATAGATIGMAFLYLAPPALTIRGMAKRDAALATVAGSAWLLMAALYRPTQRAYARPLHEALALPAAAALYMAMTVDSALAHARGRGGVWKGRANS